MIKFIAAALWICAVTLGAVFYSFQAAGQRGAAEPPKPMLGGLDYVKTDMISVPLLRDGTISSIRWNRQRSRSCRSPRRR